MNFPKECRGLTHMAIVDWNLIKAMLSRQLISLELVIDH